MVEILVGGNAWRSRGRLGRLAARLSGERRPRALAGGRVGHLGRHAKRPAGRAAPEPRRRSLGTARRKAAGLLMRLSELLNRKVVTESGAQPRPHPRRPRRARDGRLRVTGLAAGELGILERFGIGTHGSGGPIRRQGARPPHHPLGAGRARRGRGRRPRLEVGHPVGDGLRGHAVRYATLRSSKAELYYRHRSYGEPDAEVEMAYYFWLLRTATRRSSSTAGSTRGRRAARADVPVRRRWTRCARSASSRRRSRPSSSRTSTTTTSATSRRSRRRRLRAAARAGLLDGADGVALPVRLDVEPAEIELRGASGRRGRVRLDRRPRGDLRRRHRDHGRRPFAGPAGHRRRRARAAMSCWPRTRRTSPRSSSSSGRSPSSTTSRGCTPPTTCSKAFASARQRSSSPATTRMSPSASPARRRAGRRRGGPHRMNGSGEMTDGRGRRAG